MNYIPLTQVCDFQGGSQPPKEQWIDHAEDGYIRMLQIRDFTQPDKDNIEYVRLTKTVKTCNEDDILIGRYGASVGKILTGLSGAYNVAIIKTIPDASKLTKRFLYHYLNSPYFQSFILSVGSRAAQAGFNKEDLSDAQIPQLSLKEQEYVTSRLDKIVDLIALRKQQLSKLDELVKSRFIELFGDPMTNSNGYVLKKYGDLFELNAGGTPSKQKPEYWDDGTISWVGSNMCQNTVIYENDGNYITEEGLKHSSARMFPVDTVLIALVGATIGKTALLKFETTTNQNVLGVRGIRESGYTPEFIFYYTQGLYQKFLNIGDGGFAMASKGFISELPVPIVDLTLQEQFALFVEQTDKSKFEIQKSLEKLETLKKALMQKYFG